MSRIRFHVKHRRAPQPVKSSSPKRAPSASGRNCRVRDQDAGPPKRDRGVRPLDATLEPGSKALKGPDAETGPAPVGSSCSSPPCAVQRGWRRAGQTRAREASRAARASVSREAGALRSRNQAGRVTHRTAAEGNRHRAPSHTRSDAVRGRHPNIYRARRTFVAVNSRRPSAGSATPVGRSVRSVCFT